MQDSLYTFDDGFVSREFPIVQMFGIEHGIHLYLPPLLSSIPIKYPEGIAHSVCQDDIEDSTFPLSEFDCEAALVIWEMVGNRVG